MNSLRSCRWAPYPSARRDGRVPPATPCGQARVPSSSSGPLLSGSNLTCDQRGVLGGTPSCFPLSPVSESSYSATPISPHSHPPSPVALPGKIFFLNNKIFFVDLAPGGESQGRPRALLCGVGASAGQGSLELSCSLTRPSGEAARELVPQQGLKVAGCDGGTGEARGQSGLRRRGPGTPAEHPACSSQGRRSQVHKTAPCRERQEDRPTRDTLCTWVWLPEGCR